MATGSSEKKNAVFTGMSKSSLRAIVQPVVQQRRQPPHEDIARGEDFRTLRGQVPDRIITTRPGHIDTTQASQGRLAHSERGAMIG